MPPRMRDSDGNLFRKGIVYIYHQHKLELIKIDKDEMGADFRMVENYGSMKEGDTVSLIFDKHFKPLYDNNPKTNKSAASLLSKEW